MTKDEAAELIERIPYVTAVAAASEKTRLALFRKALANGEPLELLKIVKTCHIRRGMVSGRSMSAQEQQYGETARRQLHSQLAAALGIREEQVQEYIERQLKEKYK